ncbi:MAG: serine hydrolase domain-containing protein, partial [Bacteroidota bacterium]
LVNGVGEQFDYNNGDYILLGQIIEAVTGKPFLSVLQERILIPFQLNSTGLITNESDLEKLAKPYRWNKSQKEYIKNPPILYQNFHAAGAMYSTSSDLLKFNETLFKGKLIGEAKLEMLLRTYPNTQNYGYGLWVDYQGYGKTVTRVAQRYGRIWGINTLISHCIDQDLTVIVVANTNKVRVAQFQSVVGDLLFD